jgi:hypothetical protein
MYYYLFVNNYYNNVSNIILLEETYNEIQTKNIIIFLFNSCNFENLLVENKIKIVMSFKELQKYREVLKDDKYIVNFLNNKNSMKLIKDSLFGNKYQNKSFKNNYNILLDFFNYLDSKKYINIVLVSGIVYLLYGLRINRDIDLFMKDNYKINYKKIEIDPFYVTPEYMSSVSLYNNLFNNPETTFYFKGFKILTIQTDINVIRKTKAENKSFKHPKAVADIIMAKKLIDSSINIPISLTTLNKNKQDRVLKSIYWQYKSKYNPFNDKTL